ncbi:hypothetical protein DERP_009832 [Dermatophagoides pteronyssinus]|uniref:Uncharacterized protein n=1 Tax=Dermatophagoides pteronyssinus TaxID=6956 RepID=A0ABQ8IR98_DERPT|nr:hypothetical protein DERP_009832 [Dermatophagoides pteronyssinus]
MAALFSKTETEEDKARFENSIQFGSSISNSSDSVGKVVNRIEFMEHTQDTQHKHIKHQFFDSDTINRPKLVDYDSIRPMVADKVN